MPKSRLTYFLLAALACPAAHAATKTYTLADSGGSPSCDSIQLVQGGDFATGTLNGQSCTPPSTSYGLAFRGKFPGDPATVWSFSYADDSGDIFLVLLDEKALTWTLYYENPSEGIPLSEINFGRLLKSGARAGGPSIMAPRAGR